MATDAAVLNYAAELIERGWAQRKSALDFAGRPVEACSPVAVCWCACGAIDRAIFDLGNQPEDYERLCDLMGGDQDLIRRNDTASSADGICFALRRAALASAPPVDGE